MSSKTHALVTNLYLTLGRRILKVLLKRNGGDLYAAEQVLQDTFVAALNSFHTFRHKSSYFTWLTRIALNKMADYYRDQVNRRSKIVYPALKNFSRLPDPSLSLEEKLALQELRHSVNRCLNLLPHEYRRLLWLKYYKQLSNAQISLALNLSSRSLEGKLYRAKKSLAKLLASRHF